MIRMPEGFERRRRKELREELVTRARVWLPEWRPREGTDDFAGALFDIVARLESEVTQRMSRLPEKTFRGFLDWLGVRPDAGRAARLPVVFRMTAGAEPVLARAPIQLQATPAQLEAAAAPDPVTFETEDDLLVTPGSLAAVVGVDPAFDAFYLPPARYSTLEPEKPGPVAWRAKSEAGAKGTQIQLEPELGLDALPTLFHLAEGAIGQYRVTKADGGLATIEPPLERDVAEGDAFTPAFPFEPFGSSERNRQEHALYIGSESLLNLPTEATIGIAALDAVVRDATWSYWGKAGTDNPVDWQDMHVDPVSGILAKKTGSVEMRDVAGKSSRWLRAVQAPDKARQTFPVSTLQLAVNCDPAAAGGECPPKPTDRSQVVVEAIGNTTPLVLNQAFFPLGREPKLFDAFYVGCPEAFSKANASVRICFEALDGTTESLTAAQAGASVNDVYLFGVGSDFTLLRLRPTSDPVNPLLRHAAVRPPFGTSGAPSVNAAPAPLNADQPRLTAVTRGSDVIVGATAGDDAWLWAQTPDPNQGRWFLLGTVALAGEATDPTAHAAMAVLKDGDGLQIIGLNDGRLYERHLAAGWDALPITGVWRRVPLPAEWADTKWVRIAPIFENDGKREGGIFDSGWLAVSQAGKVVLFDKDGPDKSAFEQQLPIDQIVTDTTPLAVHNAATNPSTLIVVARRTTATIKAWQLRGDNLAQIGTPVTVDALPVGRAFEWSGSAGDVSIIFTANDAAGHGQVVAWFPFADGPGDPKMLYRSQPIARVHGAAGVATAFNRVIVPGDGAHLQALRFVADGLRSSNPFTAHALASALVIETETEPNVDFVEMTKKGGKTVVLDIKDPFTHSGDRFWVTVPTTEGTSIFLSPTAYRTRTTTPPSPFTGDIATEEDDHSVIEAEAGDENAARNDILIVVNGDDGHVSVHTVSEDPVEGPGRWTLTVQPAIKNAPVGTTVEYTYVTKVHDNAEILPRLSLTEAALSNEQIAALRAGGAFFAGADPQPSWPLLIHPATAPASAIFATNWKKAPTKSGQNLVLVTNEIFTDPITIADTKSTNPTLSWEYWDGQAWWRIEGLVDGTSHLRETGVVAFCVPAGLQPTDVVGRTSHWIRARLVGGDYGHESVTTKSRPDDNDVKITVTTIERSLTGITPPQLASIQLRYSVCCPTFPDFVITADGGRTRDQTEASRIDGARLEIFMPLADSIRRATGASAGAPIETGRAIYLGFDGRIQGGPISVLFLIDDGEHDGANPLQVDVLREHGFERVVADDGTRGLNETGVLTFFLSAAPPPMALFGDDTRYWLRLRPNPRFDAHWSPKIRGAFLNGVWAAAAETQDLERLGSSDGSPDQRVSLARPPVINDTLELRVNEPIGDEDVEALRAADQSAVLDALANNLPGRWVRWKEVQDPADGAIDERIYSLDHDSGTIAFGNGLHGKIPPIGVDSIVAVRYQRGGGEAANRVAAWSQITLISPLPGVDTIAAPQGAAGGAGTQTTDAVVRFAPANQFMRDRALTLRDFESLATQYSPDVAQARTLPAAGDRVRLVVVMRGRDPIPPEAVRRELSRFLAERTLPALAAREAIEIVDPIPIEVRFDLDLTIDRMEHSGAVAQEARQRLAALLDPATGGVDRSGWRLGEVPTDTDVAAALDGVPHLEQIDKVTIVHAATNVELGALQPKDLVVLASEGVVFRLEPAGAEAQA